MGYSEEAKPFFSIVMPAYNAQTYIKTAVESIQRQQFTDWELIIIDDCSTDDTQKFIRNIMTADPRIRLFTHTQNFGVSEARNRGICEAAGEYLWFVDADDRAEEDLLQKVYESLQHNRAQFVLFGLVEEYYDGKDQFLYSHQISHKEGCFTDKESLRKEFIYLEQETLYGYPWNKIYDLSYLKGLRLKFQDYKTAKFIEDITFNIRYCMDIESMNILSVCPYHYGKRVKENLTNQFEPDYFKFHKKRIEILLEQFQYWNMDTAEVREILGALYGRYILSALERNCDKRSKMNHSERYKWCRALFCQGLFNELIPAAKASDSKALEILLFFLRWKRSIMCLAYGRAVHIVRNRLPMIYSKIKSER